MCLYRDGQALLAARVAGTPDDAFLARLEQALAEAGEGWVLDGNYSRTQPIKWREVDYILWLDYGFGRTLWQAVRRACRRAASKRELWPGTGNRESFRRSFFSRESIVLWTVRTYAKNRRKYLAEMAGAGRCFIRLRSPARPPIFTGVAAGSQQQAVMDPHHRFLDVLRPLPQAAGFVRLHLEKIANMPCVMCSVCGWRLMSSSRRSLFSAWGCSRCPSPARPYSMRSSPLISRWARCTPDASRRASAPQA